MVFSPVGYFNYKITHPEIFFLDLSQKDEKFKLFEFIGNFWSKKGF